VQGQLFVRCCGERVDFQTAGKIVLLRRASLFFGDGHEPRYSTMLLLLSANYSILQHSLMRAQANVLVLLGVQIKIPTASFIERGVQTFILLKLHWFSDAEVSTLVRSSKYL